MYALLVAFFGAGLMFWAAHQVVPPLMICIVVYVLWGGLVWLLPKPKWGFKSLFAFAVLLRVILWASPPIFSDDIFRYVWEGGLTVSGGNPYLTPPSSFYPENHAIHPHINHPDIPSIYPPVAMIFFAFVGFISTTVSAMKGAFLLVDLGIILMLNKLAQQREIGLGMVWLYAIHPLPIIEMSGSGHMDGLGILCLLLAVWSVKAKRSSSFWLILGGGVKLLPAVMLPRVWTLQDRGLWAGLIVFFLCCLPFVQEPSALFNALHIYAEHWAFNGSVYAVLSPVTQGWTRLVLFVAGLVVLGWGLFKRLALIELALWVCGASILFSPTVHPWYVLWVWVPALLCQVRYWTALASLVPLSYVALLTLDPETGIWNPPLWPSFVIYGIFGGLALFQLRNPSVKEHPV